MFVPFLIISSWIVAFGPIYNEGGDKAIQEKGFKAAVEQAWDERQSYDSGSLKGTLGNYGND